MLGIIANLNKIGYMANKRKRQKQEKNGNYKYCSKSIIVDLPFVFAIFIQISEKCGFHTKRHNGIQY